jgi:hypothetical protein
VTLNLKNGVVLIKSKLITIACMVSLLSVSLWGATTVEEGDFSFRPPTERFLEEETWPKVCRGLRTQELSREHKAFFDSLVQKEEVGLRCDSTILSIDYKSWAVCCEPILPVISLH